MNGKEPKRKWYNKKRYIVSIAIISILIIAGLSNGSSDNTKQEQGITTQQKLTPNAKPAPKIQELLPNPLPPPAITPTPSSGDSYKNVDGNIIPSPKYYDSAPAGASAKCRDGTYSFSQHRSGTCSHHGGVAQWL